MAPFRRPRPDQGQVLWAEQHRLQHFRQGGGVFGLHLVDENPPPRPPEELQLYGKVPPPALHQGGNVSTVPLEADELPVPPGPVGAGGGEEGNRLQQIRLALGVFAKDDVALWVEVRAEAFVVAPALQGDGPEVHWTSSS